MKRPYTYWHISVAEQLYGDPIGSEITVRQPGGEIGEMGYHVAGAAEFSGGEEVFIALHDTEENSGIKEVVGLASGKFRIEKNAKGEQVVMSGLGLPVTGGDGKPFSPNEFKALLKRIAKKETTATDRNVFVSRNPTHEADQSAESKAREADANILRASGVSTAETSKNSTATASKSDENRVQERVLNSEEKGTGSSATAWIIASVLVLALLVGLVWALKR